MTELLEKAKKAKEQAHVLAAATTADKNEALQTIAEALLEKKDFILAENKRDLENGKKAGISTALLDRLALTEDRIKGMAEGLTQIAELTDPIGEQIDEWTQPNGLQLSSVRVPLGVVGMIYEARPNVTVDASGLCLKTGNAVILRGSSSAIESNKALVAVIHQALAKTNFPPEAVQLLEDTSREAASAMFKLNDYLDVLIPRGGASLIQTVVENATVPVLETGVGNCHVYIDELAQKEMAIEIAVNAKVQRPSVCNAAETIIVHKEWAKQHLADLLDRLKQEGVECRGDEVVSAEFNDVKRADEADWSTEYLDMIVAIKVVRSLEEAISHINRYGSKHSEAIVTENRDHAERFFQAVDAAALYHNASTRYTDGFEFGFGAEIGISTQKLHARGPMGLKALTTNKYVVRGNGQVRT